MKLIFATGNYDKYFTAEQQLGEFGIKLSQESIKIDEIQVDDIKDIESIVRDKATRAYYLLKKPLLVSDDSWEIPALKGFPGPYMHSINDWFSAEDFLRLTKDLEDRSVFLVQNVAYQDDNVMQTFTKRIPGVLLPEIRGSNAKPNELIISLTSDGKSLAEIYVENRKALSNADTVWPEVGAWLNKNFQG